jgi:iron complex transport system substrate-binding protein
MKAKRIIALILALAAAAALAACAPRTGSPSGKALLTVTDMRGREVSFDKTVERVVALTAADCEILFALGAGDLVVGRGEYCDYPAEVLSLPSVESGSDTNVEQIIALKPDVVIMSSMAQTKEQISALENAGFKVVVTEAPDIAAVYDAIRLLGAVVGKEKEAAGLIDSMRATFDAVTAKVPSGSGKTVYFEVSPLQYGLYTAGSGTFMDELAAMLGMKNVFGDLQGWQQVSEEQVIERNPDFIVTTTMSFEGSIPAVEEVLSRKGWDGITAIKNRNVYNADSNAITRPGPRLADAVSELYNFFYGNS